MIKKIFFTLVLLCFASPLPAAEITYDVEFVRKKIKTGKKEIVEKTRQLAKRQMTWLRGEKGLACFDRLERDRDSRIFKYLQGELDMALPYQSLC